MPADSPAAWTLVPFIAMLLAIALGPLAARHWWESNLHRLLVSCVLAAPVVILYAGRPVALLHAAGEYVSFMIVLAGLYVVAGGVVVRGDLTATPATNTAFLAIGGVLASLIGTTGASMVLIRPLLHTNAERTRVRHTVVVFIFLVSNCGGMLTPLGDPPLLLGYLRGVPFAWTLRLWKPWLFLMAALLALHWIWDTWAFRREPAAAALADRTRVKPLRLAGGINLVWLGTMVLAVLFLPGGAREIGVVFAAMLAWVTTPAALRRENRFTAGPMLEVAAVFLGIFITMIPALELLRTRGAELGVREPWQFFWATGALSAFLDNAPTYLAFLAIAQGLGLPDEVIGVTHRVLAGISLGAVCLGANSYIGNAPNFMVRAVAEGEGVPMPGFFAYMAWAVAILIPLYVTVSWLFL